MESSRNEFRYNALNKTISEIRLFKLIPAENIQDDIHGELISVSLDNAPQLPYETVSYVWGDPTVTQCIFLHGQAFEITVNLEGFLRHIRLPSETRTLWADVICINQQDPEEREYQVAMMSRIYQNTSCGLFWVGNVPSLSKTTLKVLEIPDEEGDFEPRMKQMEATLVQMDWQQYQRTLEEVKDFLIASAAWTRTWILQEFYSPRRVMIFHSHSTAGINWLQFWCLLQTANRIQANAKVEERRRWFIGNFLDNTSAASMLRLRSLAIQSNFRPRSLTDLLLRINHLKATEPRDHYYSLLGLFKHGDLVTPDYVSSTKDALCAAAATLIENPNCFSLLSFAGKDSDRGGIHSRVEGLPSWVPDLAEPRCLPSIELYKAGPQSSLSESRSSVILGSKNELIVRGTTIDTVHFVSRYNTDPMDDTESHLRIFKSFLPKDYERLYTDKFPMVEAVWRTLCYDLDSNGSARLTSVDIGKGAIAFREALKIKWKGLSWKKKIEIKLILKLGLDPEQVILDWVRAGCAGGNHHYYGYTKSYYPGKWPKHTEEGDIVVVVYNLNVPLVLRPCKDTINEGEMRYQVIGAAYVHGFMDGEASNMLDKGTWKETSYILI